jgi:hypothetical protein
MAKPLEYDGLPDLLRNIKKLTKQEVLIGVPSDHTHRKDEDEVLNNASLAYIHEHGSPVNNLPARPFLEPGIKVAKDKISKHLGLAAEASLSGQKEKMGQQLVLAGLTAQNATRAKINSGVEPALAPSTIAARQRRGRTGTVPLIDTGQLRNSIIYVVKEKK